MKRIDLSKYSDQELEEIGKKVSQWQWDERIGKKPLMYDKMEHYKKEHNLKYRMETLFRAFWPFTQYDYIKPVMIELARRNIKGYGLWYPYTCSKTLWQRLRLWLTSFSNRRHRV